MIKDTITQKIHEAMKAGDSVLVSTLKLLSNAIHNEEIAKQRELTDDEEIQIVRRQIKQREEAIELYKKGGRQDLSDKEQKELEILKEFLPDQMSREELEKIVEETMKEVGAAEFGRIMQVVMGKVVGRADGKVVAEIVKGRIN